MANRLVPVLGGRGYDTSKIPPVGVGSVWNGGIQIPQPKLYKLIFTFLYSFVQFGWPGKMYRLDVVTPTGSVFSGDVYQTVITTADGEIGILENHMLLLTNITPGKLRIEKADGEVKEFAVTYGVLDVRGDKVIALIEEVFELDKINVEEEKKLLEEANQKLQNENLSEEEKEHYEKQRSRSQALLDLASAKV